VPRLYHSKYCYIFGGGFFGGFGGFGGFGRGSERGGFEGDLGEVEAGPGGVDTSAGGLGTGIGDGGDAATGGFESDLGEVEAGPEGVDTSAGGLGTGIGDGGGDAAGEGFESDLGEVEAGPEGVDTSAGGVGTGIGEAEGDEGTPDSVAPTPSLATAPPADEQQALPEAVEAQQIDTTPTTAEPSTATLDTEDDDSISVNQNAQQVNPEAQEVNVDIAETAQTAPPGDVTPANDPSQFDFDTVNVDQTTQSNLAGIFSNPDNVDDEGNINEQGMAAMARGRDQGGLGRFSAAAGLGGVGMSMAEAAGLASAVGPEGTGGEIISTPTSELSAAQIAQQVAASETASQYSPSFSFAVETAANAVFGGLIGGLPGAVQGALSSALSDNETVDQAVSDIFGFIDFDSLPDFDVDIGFDVDISMDDVADFLSGLGVEGQADFFGDNIAGTGGGFGDPRPPVELTPFPTVVYAPGDAVEATGPKLTLDDLGISDDLGIGDLDGLDAGGGDDEIATSVAAIRRRILGSNFGTSNIHTGPQGLTGSAANIRSLQLTGS